MKRIPEPELMIDQEQVQAYSQADFSDSNKAFVDFVADCHPDFAGRILDIGCGPADVDILLSEKLSQTSILAIDGSSTMLKAGQEKINQFNLQDRIHLKKSRIPDNSILANEYDLIISKDLLHHLPDPMIFWKEATRLANPDTVIYLMDLWRPESQEQAREIVTSSSSSSPEVLQIDFYNSLLAAYTVEEISAQLEATELQFEIELIGARHFIVRCTL